MESSLLSGSVCIDAPVDGEDGETERWRRSGAMAGELVACTLEERHLSIRATWSSSAKTPPIRAAWSSLAARHSIRAGQSSSATPPLGLRCP
ncbi:hypothetical protein OsI_01569 [Oryza sativa Indica Group]|uniref:Uncharacterized protein n=1 Tax=Oryza sativa subsp. indica TaxID=39946 RepID=B8A6R9_ORYSI|nr:hypothetical protein OsI_01569 [Oryza sativa Indica Group]